MIVVLTDLAREQIRSIHEYIARSSIQNADLVIRRVFGIVDLLATSPTIGQSSSDSTRSFAVPKTPYKLFYRLCGNRVQILAIHHGAQSFSKQFFVQ